CNTELVALEEVSDEDEETLRALVAEHERRTGSTVAARLLADWDEAVRRFVKVMPHDYRRALELAAVSTGGDGFYTTESEEAAA
ncbi:MAG: hypothetical protein IRZ20_05780, partial [Thermoleophilia bacterium]|nr:hypothetical protein [Thermoleophilia bacterium]